MKRLLLLAGLFVVGTNSLAGAQEAAQESKRWAVMAQHNQLGLLEYCAAQGHIGPEFAARQRRAITGADPEGLVTAGRAGMIAYVEPQGTLAVAAEASGTSVAYRCALMAYRVPDDAPP